MYDQVIKLISEQRAVNEYGDMVVTETEREVFAELRSVGQSEFYQAQAAGLKPELKFVLADFCDYEDEKRLKYTVFGSTEELEYTVVRTYRNNNQLEITCKRGVD